MQLDVHLHVPVTFAHLLCKVPWIRAAHVPTFPILKQGAPLTERSYIGAKWMITKWPDICCIGLTGWAFWTVDAAFPNWCYSNYLLLLLFSVLWAIRVIGRVSHLLILLIMSHHSLCHSRKVLLAGPQISEMMPVSLMAPLRSALCGKWKKCRCVPARPGPSTTGLHSRAAA